jgi:hypothetical protein
MGVAKVILNNETLIDVTDKTVDEGNLLSGETALRADGETVRGNVVVPTKTSDLVNDSGYISTETDPTVPSWAKAANKPSYTATEVGALPDTTSIPSKTSDLTNDSGYISTETDPTVSSWAKAASKPSYTATEVGAQPTITASGLLKGNGSGTISAAVAGTDYQAPITNPITGTGQNKYLAKFNGTNSITSGPELIAAGDGKYLTHDGLWADPLPSRTGNSGKFLTTNGTAVSWANVSGVEYFTIISGTTEWTDFSATTFYNCYASGKMPIVIDGDNGNIHFYPMSIASDSCIFEGIADIGDGYCTYGALFAYEDSSDNYVDTYFIVSGSSVSYTPTLSSGTKVGTITINGTGNDIYAPAELPSQSGQSGKFLTTNGSAASGASVFNSPAFTGTPTTPTPTSSSAGTQIATKQYVDTAINAAIAAAIAASY